MWPLTPTSTSRAPPLGATTRERTDAGRSARHRRRRPDGERASPSSGCGSPRSSAARSSAPTPCSCTGAWTSGPPSSRSAERRGIPHHQLDVLDGHRGGERRGLPALGARRHRRDPGPGRAPGHRRGLGALRPGRPGPARHPADRPGRAGPVGARGGDPRDRGASCRAPRRRTRPPRTASSRTTGRRIVRALEVVELTGRPFSRRDARAGVRPPDPRQSACAPPRQALDPRIDARVDRMWELGPARGGPRASSGSACASGRTASRALGYAQALAQLDGRIDRGRGDRADDRPATRRFARRQESWFRAGPADRAGSTPPRPEELDPAAVLRLRARRARTMVAMAERLRLHQGARHRERLRPRAGPRRCAAG